MVIMVEVNSALHWFRTAKVKFVFTSLVEFWQNTFVIKFFIGTFFQKRLANVISFPFSVQYILENKVIKISLLNWAYFLHILTINFVQL